MSRIQIQHALFIMQLSSQINNRHKIQSLCRYKTAETSVVSMFISSRIKLYKMMCLKIIDNNT